MNNPVAELLAEKDKGMRRAKSVLSYLFRQALLWSKVNNQTWKRRAERLLKQPHNAHLKNDMGNLNKDLVRDEFSWSNFKKAIDFLNPNSAVLKITFEWRSGRVSTYSVVIDPAEDEREPSDSDPSDENELFKGSTRPAGSLTRLWRRICHGEEISIERWKALMNIYIDDAISTIDTTTQKRNEAITQTTRQLSSDKMTWNSLRKGINVLDPKQVTYTLQCRWPEGVRIPTEFNNIVRNPKDVTYDSTAKPKRAHR